MEKVSYNRWSRKRKLRAKMELVRASRKQRTSHTVSTVPVLKHTRVESREKPAPSRLCSPETVICECKTV